MEYLKTLELQHFEFWSGAKTHDFTFNELKTLDDILSDMLNSPTETQINDLFWFEEEFLCELLDIDFNEYLNRL